jgi:hypothetical protein
MQQPQLAYFEVKWAPGQSEKIPVQFNPTELSFSKGAQIAEIGIPGLDAPILQYVRGQAETLTLDLFFDSTDSGMGAKVTSVTQAADKFYQLVKILPKRHAPPICIFHWNSKFPGRDASKPYGNNKRTSFPCVVESVKHKYTLFNPDGVPLRATLSLSLKEYRPLNQQLNELNKHSPDRTQFHVLQEGETLSFVAGRQEYAPGDWRILADANGFEDPRRLRPGAFVKVPPIGQ